MRERKLAPNSTVALRSQNPKYDGLRLHIQLRHLEAHGWPKDPSGAELVPVRALPAGCGPDRPPKPWKKPTGGVKRRPCLGCGRSFTSSWTGNRVCQSCRSSPDRASQLEGTPD